MSAEQGAEMALHPQIVEVTARVRERSAAPRARYLAHVAAAQVRGSARGRVSCTNLAHAIAASPSDDKTALRGSGWPNLAIVSAYNDMLSAHQPFEHFPPLIKDAARKAGAIAQAPCRERVCTYV